MSDLQNAIFPISDQDVTRRTSRVKQLVDILQVDIASISAAGDNLDPISEQNNIKTRKKYEVFVTGSAENAVTSSVFQTVFDQDHTTQTANELLDITVGCYTGSTLVDNALDKTQGLEDEDNPGTFTGIDASGKKIFRQDTLMMREKINVYKQYAQYLLGDSEGYFTAPYESSFTHTENNVLTYRERIDEALFINVKRLFVRDSIVKDEFALKISKTASDGSSSANIGNGITFNTNNTLSLTDTGASTSLRVTSQGGSIGTIKKSPIVGSEDENVGLVFYEKGIVVLDAKRIFSTDQHISGSIDAVSGSTDSNDQGTGTTVPGSFLNGSLTYSGSFIPNLWTSGSIDNLIDHICETRFGRTNGTSIGLINQTYINSSIYTCRIAPSQANYSRNPTYKNSDGTLRFVTDVNERGDEPFAYITTVGLYDANNNLLAVAKTSRPIEKNPEIDLSISVRIDY